MNFYAQNISIKTLIRHTRELSIKFLFDDSVVCEV